MTDLLEGSPHLGDVEEPMPGEHSVRDVEALGAALGVDPDPRAVAFGGAIPEPDVRSDECSPQREELVGVLIHVAEALHQEVLVVRHEGRLLVREDPSQTAGDHEFGIDHVTEELDHGPLAGLRSRPEVLAGLMHQCLGVVGNPLNDLRRVLIPDEFQKRVAVFLPCGHRV